MNNASYGSCSRHRLSMLNIPVKFREISAMAQQIWSGNEFWQRACNSVNTEGRVIVLLRDTSSCPEEQLCEVFLQSLELFTSHRAVTKVSQTDRQTDRQTDGQVKNNMSLPYKGVGGNLLVTTFSWRSVYHALVLNGSVIY